jgi:hypothetical protein
MFSYLKALSIFLAVLLVSGGIPNVSALNDTPQQGAVTDPAQFSLASQIALMSLWYYNQEDPTTIIPTDIKSLNELAHVLTGKMKNGNLNQEVLTATPVAITRENLQNGDIVYLKNNPSVFMIYRGFDEGDDRVILGDYSGIYSYSSDDFDQVFTGYGITFRNDYQGSNLDQDGITITDKEINDSTIQSTLDVIEVGKLDPGREADIVPLDYDSKIKEDAAFYMPSIANMDDLCKSPKFTEWVENNIATPDDYEMTMENPDIIPTNGKKIIKLYTKTHKMYYSIKPAVTTNNVNAEWNRFKIANRCGFTLGKVWAAYFRTIAGKYGPIVIDKRSSTRYDLANGDVLNYDPSTQFDMASMEVFEKKTQFWASAGEYGIWLGNWHVAYAKKSSNIYFQLA